MALFVTPNDENNLPVQQRRLVKLWNTQATNYTQAIKKTKYRDKCLIGKYVQYKLFRKRNCRVTFQKAYICINKMQA